MLLLGTEPPVLSSVYSDEGLSLQCSTLPQFVRAVVFRAMHLASLFGGLCLWFLVIY